MNRADRSKGIAIVAVLLSAVIFLGIVVAITGTLSLSSRRSTSDQRVTLEAQYAAESGLSRVVAEAQGGLMKNWTAILLNMKPSVTVTETEITQLAKYFCNTPASTTLSKPVGNGNYCSVASGADNYATPDVRYSLFSKLVSNGTADNTTDQDGRDADEYAVNGTSLLGTKTEAEFWRDAFSPQSVRYTQSISSNVSYAVGFGLEAVGVRVIDGAVYRFVFKAADASSTGTFKNGATLVSERKTTRTFQEEYYVDLSPPSFAYFLLLTNSQVDANSNPIYITDSAINNGPVHTNGTYFIKGKPYFGDEFTSSGCASATCPAATRVIGATYNDGSSNPNDSSYNPRLVTVNYTANPNAGINFPGYDSTTAGFQSLTAPETVMSNLNGTPNAAPARPWNYTGRFDRAYERFPTSADVQKDKAIDKGINISPPNINGYTGILGSPTPEVEMIATKTGPDSSSTNFEAVTDGGTNATHQLLRIKAKTSVTKCPAPATLIVITPQTPSIFITGVQSFNAKATGQNQNSYEAAATVNEVEWVSPQPPTGVTGAWTPSGLNAEYKSLTGTTPTNNPVIITAQAKGVPSVRDTARLTINPVPKPVITAFAGPISRCINTNANLTWTITGADSIKITDNLDNVTDGTNQNNRNVQSSTVGSRTYTLSATNAGGTTTYPTTVTVNYNKAPTGTFTVARGNGPAGNNVYLPSGGGDVTFAWAIAGDSDGLVTIDNGVTTTGVAATSNKTMTVTSTTTFTLTSASGPCDHRPQVTVFVDAAATKKLPTVTLTASPLKIYDGVLIGTSTKELSTLTWTSSNATNITIDKGVDTKNLMSSSTKVAPATTTTYTATATNSFGPATATAQVEIVRRPTGALTSNPSTVVSGQPSQLSWNVSNATAGTLYLKNATTGATIATNVSAVSTLPVTPTQATRYEIWGSNGGLAQILIDWEDVGVTQPQTGEMTLAASLTGDPLNIIEKNTPTLISPTPGWQMNTSFSGSGTQPSVTYSVSVSPSSTEAVSASVDSTGKVSLTISKVPTLPSPQNKKLYTVSVTAIAGSQSVTRSQTVLVNYEAGRSSLRPRATLTQSACTYGGTPQTYSWPLFIEYLIDKDGKVSTRSYPSKSENAWELPLTSSGAWSTSLSSGFNGMIYATGGVQIGGPARDSTGLAAPAVAYFQKLTIASNGDITILRDIKYEKPVCATPPSRPVAANGAPRPAVKPATCETNEVNWQQNVLGLYTPTGKIYIDSRTNGNPALKNLKIHAVSMASSGTVEVKGVPQTDQQPSCPSEYDLTNPNISLGDIEIQGGLIQNSYGQFSRFGADGKTSCGYERNMTYDTRMKKVKYAPPFFPTRPDAAWEIVLSSSKNPDVALQPGAVLPLSNGFSRIK